MGSSRFRARSACVCEREREREKEKAQMLVIHYVCVPNQVFCFVFCFLFSVLFLKPCCVCGLLFIYLFIVHTQ